MPKKASASWVGMVANMDIVTPLEYRITCQWITKGMLNIQEEGSPEFTALLDYGDGTCDNKAILTIGNLVRELRLP